MFKISLGKQIASQARHMVMRSPAGASNESLFWRRRRRRSTNFKGLSDLWLSDQMYPLFISHHKCHYFNVFCQNDVLVNKAASLNYKHRNGIPFCIRTGLTYWKGTFCFMWTAPCSHSPGHLWWSSVFEIPWSLRNRFVQIICWCSYASGTFCFIHYFMSICTFNLHDKVSLLNCCSNCYACIWRCFMFMTVGHGSLPLDYGKVFFTAEWVSNRR